MAANHSVMQFYTSLNDYVTDGDWVLVNQTSSYTPNFDGNVHLVDASVLYSSIKQLFKLLRLYSFHRSHSVIGIVGNLIVHFGLISCRRWQR